MAAFDLMMLAISVSMFLVVAVIGMNASLGQLTYLFRRPGLFIRSILSMNVVMLAFALAISAWLDPPPAIKIGLVGLAISPVPPFLRRSSRTPADRPTMRSGFSPAPRCCRSARTVRD